MQKIYMREDGLKRLADGAYERAASEGVAALKFGERAPRGAVWVGNSSTGWHGVYRNGERLARFRDIGHTLKAARNFAAH